MRLASALRDGFGAVLGINRRNLEFIEPLNPRRLLQLAASKVRTKELLSAHGLPVAPTLAVVRDRIALRAFDWDLPDAFALKPGGGWRGGGIIVVDGRAAGGWRSLDGEHLPRADLTLHVVDILDGAFSLIYGPDEALFEPRLRSDRALARFAPYGLPDVRVLVCAGVAALAMLRLPTRESHGKANLHQGGVAVGVDLDRGITVHAVHRRRASSAHPDSGLGLLGVELPRWDEVRDLAERAATVSGLDYVGVDVVIDDELGLLVLELNGRPGLDIQLANLMGLRSVLRDRFARH